MTVTAASFVSCDKDETFSDNDIVGSWDLTAMEVSGMEVPISTLGMTLRITFNSNGTWTGSASGIGVGFGGGSYSISGQRITIVEMGQTYYWNIRSITPSRAVIDWPDYGLSMILSR